MSRVATIAPDVIRIATSIGNCYLVGTRDNWVLLDTGTPGYARRIRSAAEQHFGEGARPQAILLTHGHFDHSGCASELSDHWSVPVYAHRLELPYLTGRDKYPPPDPTVGGFMPFMSHFIPNKTYDLGERVHELDVHNLPAMPGWECLETPGHSPGHVSFFRPQDGTLLAGDAFITVNMDSFWLLVSRRPVVSRPPAYYTCDWEAAHRSVQRLAGLAPATIGAGHGEPMSGTEAARQLRQLAMNWPAPAHGRYVPEPARADERGIAYLPPPAPDPYKKVAAIGGAAVVTVIAARAIRKRAA